MAITIKELRTEFTADTGGLADGVRRATELLRRFGAAATTQLTPATAGATPGALLRRLPGPQPAAEQSPPQPSASAPNISIVNNWPALTDDLIREKILPQIEHAIRNGKIKPFKLANRR